MPKFLKAFSPSQMRGACATGLGLSSVGLVKWSIGYIRSVGLEAAWCNCSGHPDETNKSLSTVLPLRFHMPPITVPPPSSPSLRGSVAAPVTAEWSRVRVRCCRCCFRLSQSEGEREDRLPAHRSTD